MTPPWLRWLSPRSRQDRGVTMILSSHRGRLWWARRDTGEGGWAESVAEAGVKMGMGAP